MRASALVAALLIPAVASADPTPSPSPSPSPIPSPSPSPSPAVDVSTAMERARAADARARAGDFAAAALLFKQAHALDRRAEYACNVGIAYYKARDLPRAHLFLDACLLDGGALPRDFVASVWRVLATVETRLREGDFAPVELRVAPAHARLQIATFGDDEPVVGSRRIWLPLGRHIVLATAADHATRQFTLEVSRRDAQQAAIVLDPLPVFAVAPSPAGTPAAAPGVAIDLAPPPRDARSTVRRAAVGITIAAGVGAVISTGLLIAKAGDEPEYPGAGATPEELLRYLDERNQGSTAGTLAGISIVLTALTGVAAGICWSIALSRPASSAPQVGFAPAAGGGQLWLGLDF
jgi:hypothetical protein